MTQHKATVAAIRLRHFDPKNACDTRHVVGFKAQCICGWKGSSRALWAVARDDVRDHLKANADDCGVHLPRVPQV